MLAQAIASKNSDRLGAGREWCHRGTHGIPAALRGTTTAANHLMHKHLTRTASFCARKEVIILDTQQPCPTTWWVMTHLEMKQFKEWLTAENVQRLGRGESVAEPFYPADFISDGTPRRRPADTSADSPAAAALRERRQIENDLARFVFVKATDDVIGSLVAANRSLGRRCSLLHYKDTDGRRARVAADKMTAFINACIKHRGHFEFVSPLAGIEAKDEVRVLTGPFAGQCARVVRVSHAQGRLHLDLELELVNGIVCIKMSDVSAADVELTGRSPVDAIRADFIEYTQTNLLRIMEHRVKGVADDSMKRQDVAMLTRLFRYRDYHVENDAARIHFQALMLICAHLCRYADEERQLKEEALASLASINSRSPYKAATDTRAYLWIALYVATRDPAYRDAAKAYVREHQPKSERLRHFVALIRKGKKI